MFTQNKKALSDFNGKHDLTVKRDCLFSFVGKVPTLLNNRVVPCSTEKNIREAINAIGIAGIITTKDLAELVPYNLGLAISLNPVAASLYLHEEIAKLSNFQWVDFASKIDPTALIHPAAVVAERNVIIGANTTIGPGSYIKERSLIGANCTIGDGIVVGLDALEIFENSNPRKILFQSGGVKIEDNVTILSKCTVVRATFGGFTVIGESSIADVLIHIAHDVQIGKRVTLVACAEISGRCELGDDSYIGPNACLRNGVKVGRGATVSMGAVVTQDVPDNTTVSGNFAVEHSKWLQFVKSLR
jgi:UDP-3-O-[3-hydroxymyristoyl] glucosamine N-acyltransferase